MNLSDTLAPLTDNGDRLSHAYIAAGNLAGALAMAAVCSGSSKKPCMNCPHCDKASRGIHPDIIVIDKPEKKREIVVDQIREIKRDAFIVPNEAAKKVYLVNDAGAMNNNAQNAFLRILEEPPSHAVFILKTDTPSELLPTVRSRCVELKAGIGEYPPDELASDITDEFFTALRQGNSSIAKFMFELEKLDKELLAAFLESARARAASEIKKAVLRNDTPAKETLSRVDRILTRAGEYLDLNVGVGHIAGLICAGLIDIK